MTVYQFSIAVLIKLTLQDELIEKSKHVNKRKTLAYLYFSFVKFFNEQCKSDSSLNIDQSLYFYHHCKELHRPTEIFQLLYQFIITEKMFFLPDDLYRLRDEYRNFIEIFSKVCQQLNFHD